MQDTRAIVDRTAARAGGLTGGLSRVVLALGLLAATMLSPAPAFGQTISPPVLLDISPAAATPGRPR